MASISFRGPFAKPHGPGSLRAPGGSPRGGHRRSGQAPQPRRPRRPRGELLGRVVFQAEDGLRDLTVTGVQTCALPIWIAQNRARAVLREDVQDWFEYSDDSP